MLDLFDEPWDALSFEAIAAFLAGAEAEPLLWEAKGTTVDPHEVRRQTGAFANSAEGGYLILGARGTNSGWVLDGFEIPGGEPERWVSTVLLDGVRPLPTFDVRSFAAPAGRVVVVRVDPLADGPCIVRGTVYERVPGATIPVKDPTRLADLFARGHRAREIAKGSAERAAQIIVDIWSGVRPEPRPLLVSVGVAPIAPAQDAAARLFRATTREHMERILEPLVRSPVPISPDITSTVSQDRRAVLGLPALSHSPQWALAGFWDGSCAASVRSTGNAAIQHLVESALNPAAEHARALAGHLGGGGTGYLTATVIGHHVEPWSGPGVTLRRGPIGLAEFASLMPSLRRELQRTVGIDDPEPEVRDPS